jgi:putative cell wall-binding protein
VIVLVTLVALVWPGSALAAQDDTIPGVPVSPLFEDSLAFAGDAHDCFRVYMRVGERVTVTMTDPVGLGADFDVELFPPSANDFSGAPVAASATPADTENITYEATVEGWHYLDVYVWAGSGTYRAQVTRWYPGPQPVPDPERVWGADRYTTAVEIAQQSFAGWRHCEHVIIASGEDRAAADPLAAAGLSWAYGAPILLVQEDRVPASVISALSAISAQNGGAVTIHVVGGPVSVPNERLAEIVLEVPGTVTFDRILDTGNRFDLAAAIARRMELERPGGQTDLPASGRFALIANGADEEKFFDALALSPIAAANGYPILLVNEESIPAATQGALNDLALTERVVGGGPATVSDGVLAALEAGAPRAIRWAGADRYETAALIANNACTTAVRVLEPNNTGVAARLPDALSGGAFMGLRGGPVMITPSDRLDSAPGAFLDGWSGNIGGCYVLGGPVSVTEATRAEMYDAMTP